MKYLCLIYNDEREMGTMPKPDGDKMMGEYMQFTEDIKKSGHYVGGDALQPTSTATTVRVRQNKVSTTDGPFAETKEQLVGYYILDCRDLDEAVEWAAKIPTSCQGAPGYVEVRPLRQIPKAQRMNERTERDH